MSISSINIMHEAAKGSLLLRGVFYFSSDDEEYELRKSLADILGIKLISVTKWFRGDTVPNKKNWNAICELSRYWLDHVAMTDLVKRRIKRHVQK